MKENAAQEAAYGAELDRVGLSRLLDGKLVKEPNGFQETRRIIERARATVAKYEKIISQVPTQLIADVRKEPFENENIKREFIKGILKENAEKAAHDKKIWELEYKMVDGIGQMAVFLGRTRDHWTVRSDQVVFERASDVAEYNTLARRMNELSATQAAILKTMKASGLKNIRQGKKKLINAPQ